MYTRDERKMLQSAIHFSMQRGDINNEQRIKLIALIERESVDGWGDNQAGKEADELRSGIERLIRSAEIMCDEEVVPVSDVQKLLDSVDARDSLAYRELLAERK